MRRTPAMSAVRSALVAALLAAGGRGVTAQAPERSPARPAHDTLPETKPDRFSFRFAGGILIDGSHFSQDDASRSQVGEIENSIEVRTTRLVAAGRLSPLPRPWTYLVILEYRGFDNGMSDPDDPKVGVFDLSLTIPIGEASLLTIGKQKEPISFERLATGTVIPFMERAPVLDALLRSRSIGLRYTQPLRGGRLAWSAGAFVGDFEEFDPSVTARVSGTPVFVADGTRLVHLAVAARWGGGAGDSLRFRSRPEANFAPRFVDTGPFVASESWSYHGEAAWQRGPMLWHGEYMGMSVSVPGATDPFLHGGYVSGAYMLTGEHRSYVTTAGTLGRVTPRRPVGRGGWGALEVVARYSRTDLASGGVDGGTLGRWNTGVSWYPWGFLRLEVNYGAGALDKAGVDGATRFFLGRLQLEF